MDRRTQPHVAAGDRLSKLDDTVIGHILSFLPAKEAARASALSSRYHDAYAVVHTVALDAPEPPISHNGNRHRCYTPDYCDCELDADPPPFCHCVGAALLARHRRRRGGGGAVPLRALRVSVDGCCLGDLAMIEQWVSYAVQQAADAGLELDLRLRRVDLCHHAYSLVGDDGVEADGAAAVPEAVPSLSPPHRVGSPRRSPRASPPEWFEGLPSDELPDGTRSPPRRRRRSSSQFSDDHSPSPRRRRRSSSQFSDDHSTSPRRRRRSISRSPLLRRRSGSEFFDDRSPPSDSPSLRSSSELSDDGSRPPRRRRRMSGSEYSDDRSRSPRRRQRRSISRSPSPPARPHEDDVLSSSDDGLNRNRYNNRSPAKPPEYTVLKVLFSSAELRSLSLGHCRLAPPAAVSMPSLETLHLAHVPDPGHDVQRLISGCARLADLTLEACNTVTALSIVSSPRLRSLALRCCHWLSAVAVDAPELQALEYRGAVPSNSFLTLHGGGKLSIAYGKVDICGKEATSEKELVRLRQFLQLFVDVKHLHLESARLGSGMGKDVPVRFPSFSGLRHLELRGRLPGDDEAVVAAVTTILEHAPSLEAVSLVFHPENDGTDKSHRGYCSYKEEELLDAHHLMEPHATVDAPALPGGVIPACLRSKVREVNLVHYQGGRAQRTLAKFLLCNAPAIDELWCVFAEGPLWIQTELMREIRGWVMNKSANISFS